MLLSPRSPRDFCRGSLRSRAHHRRNGTVRTGAVQYNLTRKARPSLGSPRYFCRASFPCRVHDRRHGTVRNGPERSGTVPVRNGPERSGTVRNGTDGYGSCVEARDRPATFVAKASLAVLTADGTERYRTVRNGRAWYGTVRNGTVRPSRPTIAPQLLSRKLTKWDGTEGYGSCVEARDRAATSVAQASVAALTADGTDQSLTGCTGTDGYGSTVEARGHLTTSLVEASERDGPQPLAEIK